MRANPANGRRGASLYITVTGVGLMVSLMALTAGSVGRMELRAASDRSDSLGARAAARSGLEHAMNWLNRHPDWRTRLTSGVDGDDTRTPGGAGFRWRVTDADGNLADDARDHAVLRSVGFVSRNGLETAYAYEVDIEPAGRALTCLASAVHAQTEVSVSSGATVSGFGLVSSNGTASSQGDIRVEVQTNGAQTGTGYNGGGFEGAVLLENPSDHSLDWYVERGTRIDVEDLNAVLLDSTHRRMSGVVLSRALNPFGDPNPLGIYVIDCEGLSVRLSLSRILGTLVLLNAGSGTRVEDGSVLSAAPSNFPALLVDGDLSIDLSTPLLGQTLREGGLVNFNPVGAPNELGIEDDDREDTYEARIDGIVYATGSVRVTDNSILQGVLIAGRVEVEGGETLEVDHRSFSANYPPPGFSSGTGARILPGTLQRVGLD